MSSDGRLAAAELDGREDAVWPDVWSGGQVLAFSGLDGPTTWATAIEARTLPSRLGLSFDPAEQLQVVFRAASGRDVCDDITAASPNGALRRCRLGASQLDCELALNDQDSLRLTLGFTAQNLLHGVAQFSNATAAVREVTLFVELSSAQTTTVDAAGLQTGEHWARACFDREVHVAVGALDELPALVADPASYAAAAQAYAGEPAGRGALYCLTIEAAAGETASAQFALAVAPPRAMPALELLSDDPLRRLVRGPEPSWLPPQLGRASALRRRTAAKAISILRAHTFAAEGNLPRRWIASQRVKHRNFNMFHAPFLALGALTFDEQLAVDILCSALGQQQANGQIPDQAWPQGQTTIAPAPLLCWAFWEVYRATGDRSLLVDQVARLKDYVKHPLATRLLERLGFANSRGARFLTWGRGDGSNMDNSPRFDVNEPFAAVDLTAYIASEIEHVARIMDTVNPDHREAVHMSWVGEELAKETQLFFWDEQRGFFFDRYPDGEIVEARTLAGLVPLFAGVPSAGQARELIERHLCAEDGFWTPFPLASLASSDPRFNANMWRGGVFPGMNLLAIIGLQRYGFEEVADELRERTLEQIASWYERTGTLWEYYDPQGERSPDDLPRGRGCGALADYTWTAAAFLWLLHETGR